MELVALCNLSWLVASMAGICILGGYTSLVCVIIRLGTIYGTRKLGFTYDAIICRTCVSRTLFWLMFFTVRLVEDVEGLCLLCKILCKSS